MSGLSLNRRQLLKTLGLTASAAALYEPDYATARVKDSKPLFIYSLNMATIKGHKLGFAKELEIASKAGFSSVEIWMESLQTYLKSSGSLTEAKKLIDGLNIKVENAIGFAQWIADDENIRKKGLAQLRQEMDMLAQIGCHRIAAPPAGAIGLPVIGLNVITERYLDILKLGEQTGVVPQLEMWGSSKNLGQISDVLYVAAQTGHSSARILLDVFHIYKGKSNIDSIPFIGKQALEIFHMNDYPAISPEQVTDRDRVYPGDGVAPLKQILQMLKNPDKPLIISCEVFNNTYYAQDPLLVAKTALNKMKSLTKDLQ